MSNPSMTGSKAQGSKAQKAPSSDAKIANGSNGDKGKQVEIDNNNHNQPVPIGSRVLALRQDQWLRAKVVERRKVGEGDGPECFEYYMHYEDLNRRMDQWVTYDLIDRNVQESGDGDGPGKARGNKKEEGGEHSHDDGHGMFDAQSLREHEEVTKVKNIDEVQLGKHCIDCWYFSPFPEYVNNCKKLYFCEYDLNFFATDRQLQRHQNKCSRLTPPGVEIYRLKNVSMYEVDGKKEKVYCQNLCYLSKLFLDHKSLYYDVDLFLFYILCEVDDRGAHIVGYFSKEKQSDDGYNLACILTLPPYQRKGYGKFLISMSYELSKIEEKVGTPERPLSDLGKVSYESYWTRVLLNIIKKQGIEKISIRELSEQSMIRIEDILSVLQDKLNMLQYTQGQHVLYAPDELIEQTLKLCGSEGLVVDSSKIIWTPYDPERELQYYKN